MVVEAIGATGSMGPTTEFRVLGPLEVRVGGSPLALGAPKRRALLAALLLHAGQALTAGRLIESLWGEDPPRSAAANLQTYVASLRKVLPSPAGGEPHRIVTRPPGYLLVVEPGELDLLVFEELVAQGREARARGDLPTAAERFGQALRLWRGAPLDGLPLGPSLESEATRLQEWRMAVLEDAIEVRLRLGDHAALAPELRALVADHPLRERLCGQLMLALYRSGRQAEALAAYARARANLVDELGLEPGAELQRLQRAVLAGDASLELSAPSVAPPPPVSQLPADVDDFTGRGDALERLASAMAPAEEADRTAVAVAAISGVPGAGKTALAIRVAHTLRPAFPDGQLYVQLQGSSAHPRRPADVLGELLRALGVDGAAIPAGDEERAALYRSRLADRRMLVVLDDASGAAQVRPLLPGTAGCAVLATSRTPLSGLAGAHLLDLGMLSSTEACELLGRIAGAGRVAAEPEATLRIVAACGQLPLAVRIAGAKLAARPGWPLAELAGRLADERRRLDELTTADLEVRASVELSYQALDPAAARVFRLLGLLGGHDFAGWVVAVLVDGPEADRALEALVDANLLTLVGQDAGGQLRYRLHDLLRVYAHERALASDPPGERRAAAARLLGAWLHLAERAATHLPAPFIPIGTQLHPAARWIVPEGLVERLLAVPQVWFAVERANLVAAVALACLQDLHDQAVALANALTPFFNLHSRWDDWEQTQQAVLAAATRSGDQRAIASAVLSLGNLEQERSNYDAAARHYQDALIAFEGLGDWHAATYARAGRLIVIRAQGRLVETIAEGERCLSLFRSRGDRSGEAHVLRSLAYAHRDRGELDVAARLTAQALVLYRQLGQRLDESKALQDVGLIHQLRHHYEQAIAAFQEKLALTHQLGHRRGEAYALGAIADAELELGHAAAALERLEQTLVIMEELGDRRGQALCYWSLGKGYHALGRPSDALTTLRRAMLRFRELELPHFQARALRDLGTVYAGTGDGVAAEAAWEDALAICQAHGFSEAAEVSRLIELGGGARAGSPPGTPPAGPSAGRSG